MLFHTQTFLIFFALIFFTQQIGIFQKGQGRTLFLLIISYAFYLWDSPTNLIFILFSTILDYFIALKLSHSHKKLFLILSLLANFSLLLFFKSYNFLQLNSLFFATLFPNQTITIPLGISFYTFQTVSYTIDVYRRDQHAEKNFFLFALYVSFFPQLIAGPIERAQKLLPQLRAKLQLSNISEGLFLFSVGLLKKTLIGDRLHYYTDIAMRNVPQDATMLHVLLVGYMTTLQIYCDFSGYTDMARGLAKLMGIELSINFKAPFFAASPIEFWQRWHITLTRWFMDYVYYPLLGENFSVGNRIYNILLVFALMGIWHGFAFHYVVWGVLLGVTLAINTILRRKKWFTHSAWQPFKIILTFHIFVIVGFYFSASGFSAANTLISHLSNLQLSVPNQLLQLFRPAEVYLLSVAISLLLIYDYFSQYYTIESLFGELSLGYRWSFYIISFSLFLITGFSSVVPNSYVYFQF